MYMSGPQPLANIKVLDLAHVLAGPYCSGLLGLMGADVIKVEQPGRGDLMRSIGHDPALNDRKMGAGFLSVNAGKRCIAVDFKSAAGAEVIRRLAAESDVVVESFRAGALDALGLGHENLLALNPRLVYCAISGFGQDGPMRGVRAYDHVMQAISGLMSLTGEPEGPPQKVGIPITDNATGLCAVFAIASALYAREHTGRGAFIDVSMLESTYSLMASHVAETLMTGVSPARVGNSAFTRSPSSDCFQTADGNLLIGANTEAMCASLLQELELSHLLEDERFAERDARIANRDAFRAELEHVLKTRSASEWEAGLRAAGLPCSVVRDLADSLLLEQNEARDIARRQSLDDELDSLSILGAPFKIDGERAHARSAPRALGADTAEVLEGLGYSAKKIDEMLAGGIVEQST